MSGRCRGGSSAAPPTSRNTTSSSRRKPFPSCPPRSARTSSSRVSCSSRSRCARPSSAPSVRAGLAAQAMPQLPRARRRGRGARARARRRRGEAHAGPADPPGGPGRRKHAGLREELEPGGDDRAGGLPRDAPPQGTGAGARRLAGRCRRRFAVGQEMHCGLQQSTWVPGPASIAATAAIAAAALLYLRGFRRLHSHYPEIAAGCRPGALFAGLAVLWIVIASPLSTLDHRLLTFHMLQHLVLMTIAAPLLLLASPGAAFLRGLPVPARRAAIWALRSDRVRRIGRALTHPAVCWLVGTGVVLAWHVPAAHELGLRSSSWHLVQHATFFASGLLFWWPVVHGTPRTALGAAP